MMISDAHTIRGMFDVRDACASHEALPSTDSISIIIEISRVILVLIALSS